MNHRTTLLTVMLFSVAACGCSGEADDDGSSSAGSTTAPATFSTSTPAPTSAVQTSTVTTTAPTTSSTAPPTTVEAPSSTSTGARSAMTVDELAAVFPDVDGYRYDEAVETSVWGIEDRGPVAEDAIGPEIVQLSDLATAISRPVYVEGGDPTIGLGWVAEVSAFDAGDGTAALWMDVVDGHRVPCLGGPSIEGSYVYDSVPGAWSAIGDEIVLTGASEPDGNIGAAWMHDGLIWAVSGRSDGMAFVTGLIGAQEATGSEPEEIDVTALEGVLADAITDVPGFEFYAPEPDDVVSQLGQQGNCTEHLVSRSVVLTDALDTGGYVFVYGLAAPCRQPLDESTLPAGWSLEDVNGVPAARSGDGTEVYIMPGNGVVADVVSWDARDVDALTPVLEMLAGAAASIEL